MINKWFETNTGLIVRGVAGVLAGLSMMIYPEHTSMWVIMGVGLIWSLEGLAYILKFKNRKFLNKAHERLIMLNELRKTNDSSNIK